MPPLAGFSNNPFQTHSDFRRACISLLRSLQPYQSPGGARIRLPLVTGTHFDDIAAQLEGYARPLWAIGSLLHGNVLSNEEITSLVSPYVRGLANGTDPAHSEYWGPVVLRDQRMVEMEIISFALLAAPDALFHSQTPQAQRNITTWLSTLNGKDFPATNWLWFRVMTNLALVKVCRVPYDEVRSAMAQDFALMENFYRGQGWAADGIWDENGRQADYYSGSFAIQFSQLLYVKMAKDLDPERCETFRDRAVLFASSFWRYFDVNGATIPFGRSLTYRFAFAGFWSAAAFAEVALPAPLDDWGVVKGLLMRHFRWWSDKHDIFNIDGTLTIGFTYPNMYMSEDYNSPQSPYWAMKSFIALGLPAGHPFWTAEEKPLPLIQTEISKPLLSSMQIICNTPTHHFLLSSGQFCPWPLKATEAKYGKFAYSSHFSFSVPTGPLLAQTAPDSTLALSKDEGDTWRVPWKVHYLDAFSTALLVADNDGKVLETIPTLTTNWKPWRDVAIEVSTTLVAPCSRWPDWHVRLHRLRNRGDRNAPNILAVQGGFAIQGRKDLAGEALPDFDADEHGFFSPPETGSFIEGTLLTPTGALICSNAGASGIRPLEIDIGQGKRDTTSPKILKPDANTNLMWQRTLIPTVDLEMEALAPGTEMVFASAVFAIARTRGTVKGYTEVDIRRRWGDLPVLSETGKEGVADGFSIVLDEGK
ncbi:hypothetical protein BDV95DRAFT_539585 [Massariosphaeria phaeospora]|uniref:DUF2264 domain-containing protein n=1 Tax=Massariosphaeria phaeospora TaxID=100035 RepID=A0A7C8MBT0_9PLEO|nr:hypothetical protein BDV95DRAFT_539585 [Massariosphaeria phaeospora]